jgi:phosphohistidine phosphatase
MKMKRLILLRHAKSDWAEGTSDHERPLNKRGRRDAPAIGAAIAELGWAPEVVFSSDAARTRETWERMRETLGSSAEATFSNALYLGDLEAIRQALGGVGSDVTTVMFIGHNPGWEDAASTLTGETIGLTTCNAAMLSVEADTWPEAASLDSRWRLEHLLRPREL